MPKVQNRDRLRQLFNDLFLLRADEFRFDLRREEVETWDSLGVVALAVGVTETFHYHMSPDEALSIKGVGDLMVLLQSKGVDFDACPLP